MIDEKKLIEAFRASVNAGKESFPIDFIIECIEGQPKVEKWIPVSEQLPDEEEFINAYLRNRYAAEFIVMIKGANRPTTLYFTRNGEWVDEKRDTYDVIAWQPLPEPYHGGREE